MALLITLCLLSGPSAPYIVNLTCQTLDSLYVQWERPQIFFNRIDYYFVNYRSENSWDFEEIALASPHERAIDHGVSNLWKLSLIIVAILYSYILSFLSVLFIYILFVQ